MHSEPDVSEVEPVAPIEPADPRVAEYLDASFAAVSAYAALLADQGVLRGLIGPREVPRLWDRHILNSAAVAQFLPASGTLVDVGSGAGLPGIVLAAMRPDLRVVLVEPMDRRTTWLTEVVERVGLANAEVVRARADELHGSLTADAVTARAVAPLAKLGRWTLPLLTQGGVLLAMKGRSAADELAEAEAELATLGGDSSEVLEAHTVEGVPGTFVVRVVKVSAPAPPAPAAPASRSRASKRRRTR